MRLIPALLTCLIASHATAVEYDQWGIMRPPERYLRMPMYKVPKITLVPQETLQVVCQPEMKRGSPVPFEPMIYHGCAINYRTYCDILIDETIADDPVRMHSLLDHELAHCKGWPGDHPD